MQTFTGTQYLQMDIASSFGHDDKTWNERLAWFHDNEHQLDKLTGQAEEPAQFYAGVRAYRDTLEGKPSGYMCGLDATASGLQLLALLSGCKLSASICNLINTGRREDAYNRTHAHINQLLNADNVLERKPIKAALMTHLYGSKAEPKKTFGEDTAELRAFYQAIDDLLPGADMLNRDLISLWNSDAYAHSWTLPDGFEVVCKVMDTDVHAVTFLGTAYEINEKVNRPMEQGLAMGANIIHSIDGMVVREMNRRCNYTLDTVNAVTELFGLGDVAQSTARSKDLALLRILALFDMTGFMSAVIIEHLDVLNFGHLTEQHRAFLTRLIDSLPDRPFAIVCIHDCFKFHANYGNDVRHQYRNILAELAESEILSALASEISGRSINVKKLSHDLPALIRESEYAIC